MMMEFYGKVISFKVQRLSRQGVGHKLLMLEVESPQEIGE